VIEKIYMFTILFCALYFIYLLGFMIMLQILELQWWQLADSILHSSPETILVPRVLWPPTQRKALGSRVLYKLFIVRDILSIHVVVFVSCRLETCETTVRDTSLEIKWWRHDKTVHCLIRAVKKHRYWRPLEVYIVGHSRRKYWVHH
jgi:hypothetical protein